jgi:hypothetical protein
MKKIMIALAAVAAGVAVHAATVDWQYQVTASATDYHASNYALYLVDATKWDAAKAGAGITADTFTDNSIVYAQTTFAAGTGKGTSKTYISNIAGGSTSGASATALSDSIVADGGTLNVYYVILDTSKDPNEYYASSKTALTGRSATGTAIQTGFGSVANSAVTWTATSVPEPTSGLLMLLGIAGLALKRRRA